MVVVGGAVVVAAVVVVGGAAVVAAVVVVGGAAVVAAVVVVGGAAVVAAVVVVGGAAVVAAVVVVGGAAVADIPAHEDDATSANAAVSATGTTTRLMAVRYETGGSIAGPERMARMPASAQVGRRKRGSDCDGEQRSTKPNVLSSRGRCSGAMPDHLTLGTSRSCVTNANYSCGAALMMVTRPA